MQQCRQLRNAAVLVLAALILSTACTRSQNTHFYVLSPIKQEQANTPAADNESELRIVVSAVRVPEYLDRTQIATRTGSNSITFSEYHRWAEPLAGSIRSILATNLSVLMPKARVTQFSSGQKTGYRVGVAIQRFEREGRQKATLSARWEVASGQGVVLQEKTSELSMSAKNKSSEALAEALSRLLGDLSKEIADAIRDAEQKQEQAKGTQNR